MVGSTIPYSPFECAVTHPKLNAMQYCYGVGSNFITGAPPEFEGLLTLRLCIKPKYNNPNCVVSKQGFTQSDLPDPIHNETSIHMRMTVMPMEITFMENGGNIFVLDESIEHMNSYIRIYTCEFINR
jgi:hypothetical protein